MLTLFVRLAVVVLTFVLSIATLQVGFAALAAIGAGLPGGWEVLIFLPVALVAWWRFLSRRADRFLARWDRFRASERAERAEQQREGARA